MCDKHQWHLSPHGTRSRGFRTRIKYPKLVLRVDQIRKDLNYVQVSSLRDAQVEALQTGTKLQLPLSPQEQGTPHISNTATG